MVFLILSRKGYDRWYADIFPHMAMPVIWLRYGVLSHNECQELWRSGTNLTVFSETIRLDNASAIAEAVATIEEHHPDDVLWIEGQSNHPNR